MNTFILEIEARRKNNVHGTCLETILRKNHCKMKWDLIEMAHEEALKLQRAIGILKNLVE